MANQRLYNEYVPYDRPKQPRNKYGMIYNTTSTGTTIYGSSSSSNQVGGSMASLSDFRGATRTEDGVRGIVPAPLAGQNLWFLQGSGGWTRIPAFEWMSEFPTSDGLEKSGLQVNGDFNVTDTLTTMNLEVQGAAHFWSLIIDEVKAQGGQVLVSPSMFHVDFVGEAVNYNIFDSSVTNPLINLISARSDIYNILKANDVEVVRCRRLWQKCDDGKREIENECQIGDMMRCRQFNIKAGAYRDVANKDYWTFVVNTGEGNFTDEDGNTFEGFYIDIAYTLRKSDGHNIPLGSTLYSDGTSPKLPSGYTEIRDALELKRVSSETLDGSIDVVNEFYENSEWSSITENVIKIRGLDDALSSITGKNSSNNLYDNEQYVVQTQEMLDTALNGRDTSTTSSINRSPVSITTAIIDGSSSTDIENPVTGLDEVQAVRASEAILGNNLSIQSDGIRIRRNVGNTIVLSEDTFIERPFTVVEDVYDSESGEIIYHAGDTLTYGDTLLADTRVVDTTDSTDIKGIDTDTHTEVPLPDSDIEEITSFTPYTQSGIDRDTNSTIDEEYSTKSSWSFGYVGYYPEFRFSEGDSLACLGHLFDDDRSNAIVLSSTNPIDPELVAPAMAQYNHINVFGRSISQFRQTAIAANGNEFIGSFLVNYNNTYVDINERINLMIMDIKSGLESVGIHLDGDSSTITLVGSVDLRQHSSSSYDTLNLYDGLGVKRLEITPFSIPPKSQSNQIDITRRNFNSSYVSNTAPSSYITRNKYKDWDGPFWYSWVYEYTLDNFVVQFNSSVDIGYLEEGTALDLRDLKINLTINPYLCGWQYDTNRGLNRQHVTSFTWKLKCNGVDVDWGNVNYSSSGENTSNITLYSNEIELDIPTGQTDFKTTKSGTYTLEVGIGYNVYAFVRCGTDYNNPYFSVNSNFTGSVNVHLNRAEVGENTGYKMTIGTNGLELVTNNSRHFYVADDGFELEWDNNYITMDDTRGLYVRRDVENVRSNKTLGVKKEVIFCENTTPHTSYTVTLPSPSEYGMFREMTILGWTNIDGTSLTVATQGNEKIEIVIAGYQEVSSIVFGASGCPIISLTLMATSTDRWRIINMI